VGGLVGEEETKALRFLGLRKGGKRGQKEEIKRESNLPNFVINHPQSGGVGGRKPLGRHFGTLGKGK